MMKVFIGAHPVLWNEDIAEQLRATILRGRIDSRGKFCEYA